jgi:endonuclease/exonuclease/phosphatase family metal-dependent hydrolase
MTSFIKCIFIEINADHKNFLIGCVYRPPNSDQDLFNAEMLDILKLIDSESTKLTLLIGDFNLDLLKHDNHPRTGEFINNLLSYSFFPTILNPTRISNSSATLIDNIFINKTQYTYDTAIVYNDISDYLPIVMHLDILLQKKSCHQ